MMIRPSRAFPLGAFPLGAFPPCPYLVEPWVFNPSTQSAEKANATVMPPKGEEKVKAK